MSNSLIINTSLQNKLLSALKIDDLWVQFLESYAEEISLYQDDTLLTKDIFNIYAQLEDGLLDIAKTFGYIPNLIIDNSLEMVRKEVQSIPIRIRNKTTYDGYYIIFKQINRIGEVYNYYWSGEKLIRAIKYKEIIDSLNSSIKFTEPFLNIFADKNFSVISSSNPISLDSGYSLDTLNGNFNWQLDENIQISPTKHLGLEYYTRDLVSDLNGKEYLLYSDYFRYLSVGVEYNRRVPIVPHIGVQVIGITSESGSFNYFDTSLEYSIPTLKLKVSTTYEYTRVFTPIEKFDLDGSLGLDELINWELDTEESRVSRLPITSFKYISCGRGKLNIPNETFKNIFPYNKIIFFYTYSGNDNSNIIKDYSNNNIETLINIEGETKKIEGIIGKTVNFNGSTYVKSVLPFNFIASDLTLGFWINPNSSDNFNNPNPQYIIDFGFLKVWYVYSEQLLYVSLVEGSSIIEKNYSVLYNNEYNLIFEFFDISKEVYIYINSNVIDIIDYSSINLTGSYYITIGSEENGNNNFIGIIDSTWMLSTTLSQENKNYIYENKQGILTHLGDKLSQYEIDLNHEIYETEKWYLIQSYIKANDVTSDFAFNVDEDVISYVGTTNFYPIKSNYFSFTYEKLVGFNKTFIKILANENGDFYNAETNENISGSINYDTGEYSLFTITEKFITQEKLKNPSNNKKNFEGILEASILETTNFKGIKQNSIEVTYQINGTIYIAKDNGLGVISGLSVVGTINYDNGFYELSFDLEVDDINNVLVSYTYNSDLGMINQSSIYFEYKLENSITVTEVGLEDENNNLLAYMTFPPIQFDTINDHASIVFAIRKL